MIAITWRASPTARPEIRGHLDKNGQIYFGRILCNKEADGEENVHTLKPALKAADRTTRKTSDGLSHHH